MGVRGFLIQNVPGLINNGADITVTTFVNLPSAADNTDKMAIVLTDSGIAFINKKYAGTYISDGADWLLTEETDGTSASVDFDNTVSGLTATTVKGAIDELKAGTLATDDFKPNGIITGCKVSVNAGDNTKIDVSAGKFYIQGIKYNYVGVTAQDPEFDIGEDTVFIYLDATGLQFRNTIGDLAEWTATQLTTQGTLARLTSVSPHGPGAIISRIRDDRWILEERSGNTRLFQAEAIGNIYASGGEISASSIAFQLNQSSGILYDVDRFRHILDNITDIDGLKIIASGPTVIPQTPLIIPKTFDDGVGGETALTTNLWASHTILKSPKGAADDGEEGSFILIISGANYNSQALAANAAIEFGPFVSAQVVSVARILVRGGSIAIEEIIDERPQLGISTSIPLASNTIQDIYDNSINPEIVTDLIRGGLTVKGGTGTDTDFNYEGENNAGTTSFTVEANGDVKNTNNSYGAISDLKLKENIIDATPKLADLMKVKIRQFNFKNNPESKQIGVIAQELEKIFPKLIEDMPDYEKILDENWKPEDGQTEKDRPIIKRPLGTFTKAVKYSVLVPMLIKAIQEQQIQIEKLTEKIVSNIK